MFNPVPCGHRIAWDYFFQGMDQKARDYFEKASQQLRKANEELYKPEEDVVSFLVCKNSLNAIENYFKGYLSKRGFETKGEDSIDLLLERCRLLDKKFNRIDLSVIDCSANPDHNRFCEDVEKVTSCFQSADHLENFLIKQGIV